METIKKKINALKEDNEIKQEEIERLQVPCLLVSLSFIQILNRSMPKAPRRNANAWSKNFQAWTTKSNC